MPDTAVVTLAVAPTFSQALAVRVLSASGLEGDENLTLVARLFGPMPDESWEIQLSPQDAQKLWRIIGRIEPPFAESELIGLDGTSYGLTVRKDGADVELSWWQTAPDEWEEPKRLFREVLWMAGPRAASFARR